MPEFPVETSPGGSVGDTQINGGSAFVGTYNGVRARVSSAGVYTIDDGAGGAANLEVTGAATFGGDVILPTGNLRIGTTLNPYSAAISLEASGISSPLVAFQRKSDHAVKAFFGMTDYNASPPVNGSVIGDFFIRADGGSIWFANGQTATGHITSSGDLAVTGSVTFGGPVTSSRAAEAASAQLKLITSGGISTGNWDGVDVSHVSGPVLGCYRVLFDNLGGGTLALGTRPDNDTGNTLNIWQTIDSAGETTFVSTVTANNDKWLGVLAAAPSAPDEGWTYYDSTLHKRRTFDGTAWQNFW